MNLTPDAEARRLDPAITRTWEILATIRGEATEFRVCWSYDDDTYHVVEQPDGPGVVVLGISRHGDYVSALRAVAAYVEEQEVAAGRHAAGPFDIRPRLRIRRTWDCVVGEHAGLVGVGLEPLYVTAEELRQLQALYERERSTEPACPGCGLGHEMPGGAPGVIVTEHALGCPKLTGEEF